MGAWYCAPVGTALNPRLAEAAGYVGCSRAVAIAAWHLILENAAELGAGGRIDITPQRIAAALCETITVAHTLLVTLDDVGLINEDQIVGWERFDLGSEPVRLAGR